MTQRMTFLPPSKLADGGGEIERRGEQVSRRTDPGLLQLWVR
jgi:hypothetical protein